MSLGSSNRKILRIAAWGLICWLSFPVFSIAQAKYKKPRRQAEASKPAAAPAKYLFVWAGDQARQAPDFLAVVDFDESSANYGKIITTLPLPGPGATGNEPHHVGLSSDG